jgi:CheY-like chemotaxis protein
MGHILVADDDSRLRSLMARVLLDKGHRVTEAANGCEAIKVYYGGSIDLFMPEKDGFETLRALSKIDPGVRAVAISGGSMAESTLYLHIAKLMGATQVLEKPFGAETLFRAVDSVLGGDSTATRRDSADICMGARLASTSVNPNRIPYS